MIPAFVWPAEAIIPSLHQNDIWVWAASLLQPAEVTSALARLLSIDEQARADRFKFESHRHHFIVGRGLLRLILGQYLNTAPNQIEFEYGPHQKPGLVGTPLQFNLAHSGDVAVYAITLRHALGIDVEAMRPMADMLSIAKRFFAPAEYHTLRRLPPVVQPTAFYHCWTRKEAYLKATGEGLSLPLDKFEVSLNPGQPAAILTIAGETEPARRWSLTSLEPAPGYLGALAVHGQGQRVMCRQLIIP
jgi:4'-phosphopantetheinyl transferase